MIERSVYEFEPYSKAFDYYFVYNKLLDGEKVRDMLSEKYRCSFRMTVNGFVIRFKREEDFTWFVLRWS